MAVCSFSSQWAANSAIQDYGTDPNKVRVIPYGANLFSPPSAEQALDRERLRSSCQLLFIGRKWDRKGGPMVFSAFMELLRRGVDANLVVVGCDPGHTHEKLEVISFLNKQVPEDLERYLKLWRESAFLFMPSQQETFGAIYSEAAANGVPVIARDTGGISSCVKHGVSGCLLPEDADATAYADVIEKLWADPEQYDSYVRGARARFEQTLNWDAWAEQIISIISTIV
ncbi:MAG: glycosyltransferase family 4 protein [Cyanobacteria bacterium J06641_5]